MRSLATAAGVALGAALILLSPLAAWATALVPSAIDTATFDGITGAEVAAALESPFDFEPATAGGDGSVTSVVFEGAGAALGSYVYLYQIELFSTASEDKISGITFDFGSTPVDVAGIGNAFYISDDGGDRAPYIADHSGSAATFIFYPFVAPGETSHSFGLVSPNAPGTVTATLLDSGIVYAASTVYSNGGNAGTVPEPGAPVLFAAGLLTVALTGRRRGRRE